MVALRSLNVALAADNVWAVGQRNDAGAPDHELILHWDGQRWSVSPSASHGTASAALYAISASADGLWAVGHFEDGGARQPLIERHTGR